MIENVTSETQFVYHYTKARTALDYILRNRSLRFGPYNRTNDPKESKNWQFDFGTNEERDLGKYSMKALSEHLSSGLKRKTKLACFSMDSTPLTGNHLNDIYKRGFCKPRMWAQYAENHTGVCLVFDFKKLSKLVALAADKSLLLSGPVEYVNRNMLRRLNSPDDQQYVINIDYLEQVGKDEYIRAHLATHYHRLFFEKMLDWRDESEWRYVVFSESDDDLIVDIENSLTGIIFGENTQEETIEGIMKDTAKLGLRYMGLKWKNCSPWYDYANPRYLQRIHGSPRLN